MTHDENVMSKLTVGEAAEIRLKLINNDCIAAMKEMPDNSVDSIVTDPPYELGFMGKSWDSTGIAFNVEVWQEAIRVLKPGGHLIAFSGSRTYHRMAVAIEDAGFEIRDQIMWVYGSGFPKSHNVSKGIDKAAGAEREVIGSRPLTGNGKTLKSGFHQPDGSGAGDTIKENVFEFTAPATLATQQWDGWGTALKPAHEPIVLARKPLVGTVANNVLTYGTGGLNIDGSRVEFQSEADKASATPQGKVAVNNVGNMPDVENDGRKELARPDNSKGRWPANFIHDGSDEVNDLLGEPARFFYCAKISKRDRNEGLDGFDPKKQDESRKEGNVGGDNPRNRGVHERVNHHPTVKPTDLMRYFVKLVTPPSGTVLDPFMGSGSTGKACAYEGFDFIGIDQSAEYVEIARARIEYAQKQEKELK